MSDYVAGILIVQVGGLVVMVATWWRAEVVARRAKQALVEANEERQRLAKEVQNKAVEVASKLAVKVTEDNKQTHAALDDIQQQTNGNLKDLKTQLAQAMEDIKHLKNALSVERGKA